MPVAPVATILEEGVEAGLRLNALYLFVPCVNCGQNRL